MTVENDPGYDEFRSNVEAIVRNEFGVDYPVEALTAASAAVFGWVQNQPYLLEDLQDEVVVSAPELRIGRSIVMRMSMAWRPLVVGTALFIALIMAYAKLSLKK